MDGLTADEVRGVYGEPVQEVVNDFGRLTVYRGIAVSERGPGWSPNTSIRFGPDRRVDRVLQ